MWCLSHVSSLVDFLLHYGLQNCQMRDRVRVQEFVLRIIDIFQLLSFRDEKKKIIEISQTQRHASGEVCFYGITEHRNVVFQVILINVMSA